jgi:hypothetical protein
LKNHLTKLNVLKSNCKVRKKDLQWDVFDYNQLMSVLSGCSKPREPEIWAKDLFQAAAK